MSGDNPSARAAADGSAADARREFSGGRASGGRGAAGRVVRVHAQTRRTLRLALLFVAGSAAAAPLASSRWLPLHLFLAGGVLLAISGVSQMLTVTWSAAPAPPDRPVAVQRALVAGGAAGVAVGREAELPDVVVGLAGSVYVAGLVALAWLLMTTIRRGVERRFDVAVAAYVTAVAAGVAGTVIAITLAVGTPSLELRAAHASTNLLGLVGLVVAGTMPFFASTVGRSRMSPHADRRSLASLLGWMAAMLAVAVLALVSGAENVAAFGLGGYCVGIAGVLWLLPRPTRRQLRWAGPRWLALWAGAGWWLVSVAATAVDAAAGDRLVFGGRWVLVLVIGGYAQILWGSLAYLLPMLRGGGHELLASGFAATRSWIGLAAANAAAVSAAASLPANVTGAAVVVWVLDSAWRAGRVGTASAGSRAAE